MKKLFTLTLVLLLSFNLYSQTKVFETNEFKVEYPKNWVLDTSGKMNSKFILFSKLKKNDKFRENINLTVQNLSGHNFTMESYVKLSENQIKNMLPEAKIIESRSIENHHETVWQGKVGINILKFKQHYFIKNEKAYVLTFTALVETYEKFILNGGDKILKSFKIK